MTAGPGREEVRRILVGARGVLGRTLVRRVRAAGMEAVAAFAEPDADAPHVDEADFDAYLGEGPVAQVWSGVRLVELAMDAGCDAIHPGRVPAGASLDLYAAAGAANVLVLGLEPRRAAETLDVARMAARARAAGLRVPPMESVGEHDDGIEVAARVGLPLRVVPAHGGAIRRVDAFAQLDELVGTGRPAVLVHEVPGPAWIEVVVVGDRDGVVPLGAVDWRGATARYPTEVGVELLAPVVSIAREVGLIGVATVRFRIAADGTAWWEGLRPQLPAAAALVEAVQGVDLVRAQLETATGHRLGWSAADARAVAKHGVSVRVRRTGPGGITALTLPSGEGLTVTAAVQVGTPLPEDADLSLVELVAVADDAGAATVRLQEALDGLGIAGVPTDLDLVRAGVVG